MSVRTTEFLTGKGYNYVKGRRFDRARARSKSPPCNRAACLEGMAIVVTTKTKGSYKPGIKAPLSGQIRETGSQTEKTVIRGKRFPPTSAPGNTYVYVDVTKHKSLPAGTGR